MRKPRNSRRGDTLVETALVLTIALTTFIGLIDLGTVLFRLQGLTERARAGARYAVVNTYDAASIRNVVVFGNSAGSGSPLLGLTPELVTVTSVDFGDDQVKIQVQIAGYQVRFFTPFISSLKTLPTITVSLSTESLGAAG
jgi:Flp pilus assembly protein TadG